MPISPRWRSAKLSVIRALIWCVVALWLMGCGGTPPPVESFFEHDSRFVKVDDTRIHYFDFGPSSNRTPIIWVHGYAGGAFEAYYISDLLGRRLIALDLPGSGLSEKPDDAYSVERFAEVVLGFADELEVDRFVLVGHSLGGAVASTIAADPVFAKRIEKLVLIAPYGLEDQAGAFLESLSDREALVRFGMLFYNPRMLERFLRRNTFHDPEAAPQALAGYYSNALFHTNGGKEALVRVTTDVIGTPLPPRTLSSIEVPTLIVWGRNDEVLPFEDAIRFSSQIPSSRVASVSRSGHLPHVERPGAVAFLINLFLESP
jgi:pimeloyl-ACP methyl ester carboxylesterase